ncbi:hypothetical protein [Streptomyces hundungensis]|uniref:hypothetical protein n=1 Tax=Streptomyces hundungensis TaxID=1077946 RepID=UPI000EAA2E76|nr:hypothetical protein [Streptomyces hundungensis]
MEVPRGGPTGGDDELAGQWASRHDAESGRCAALLDICTTMPAGVLERLLGISPAAADRWAAGAAYAAEVAHRSDG